MSTMLSASAEAQLEVLGDEFLPVFAEKPANYAVHQRGRDFRCRDPVGFVGEVDFDQRLGQRGQLGVTEGDASSSMM